MTGFGWSAVSEQPDRKAAAMLLANLPWYDLAEVAWAHNALWERLARNLRRAGLTRVPRQLNRSLSHERLWASRQFLFGQACGYDVLIAWAGRLRMVATPRYAAPGCDGSMYRSFVVVRERSPFVTLESLRGSRCAVNTLASHSGMNVLRALVAPLHCEGRFFSQVRLSGSHERSLALVARGVADVAAIDCVTWTLLRRHRPDALRGTRVLLQTPAAPAPPYVTASAASAADVDRLQTVLLETLDEPSLAAVRSALLLDGADVLTLDAYRPIADLHRLAHDCGYHEIPARIESLSEKGDRHPSSCGQSEAEPRQTGASPLFRTDSEGRHLPSGFVTPVPPVRQTRPRTSAQTAEVTQSTGPPRSA